MPVLVLGCITTCSMFLRLDDCNVYQHFIAGGLSLLLTILTAVSRYVGRNLTKFTNAAAAYDDIKVDVDAQLSEPVADRKDCTEFKNTVAKSMKELKKTAPPIPHTVYKRYLKDIDAHLQGLGIKIHDGNPEDVIIRTNEQKTGRLDDDADDVKLDVALNDLSRRNLAYQAYHAS